MKRLLSLVLLLTAGQAFAQRLPGEVTSGKIVHRIPFLRLTASIAWREQRVILFSKRNRVTS